jgi:hypothetical protein
MGRERLYISPGSNLGRNSFSASNAQSTSFIEVDTITGDELVKALDLTRIDLIKIDVEGAEFEVLRGFARTLSNLRPALILELLPKQLAKFHATEKDIRQYLGSQNYTMMQIDSANVLALPD